ncbi:MAG: ABC transporter permease [Bacilli bacterium]
MFWHNFKYTLKTLLRNKMLIFWTFAFPILLATFFNMAFSDIENSEKLSVIDLAVVDSEDYQNNKEINQSLKELSDESSDTRLFNTVYVSLDEANQLLEDKKISGYLTFEDNGVNIVVNDNGINETIIRYTVDEITSNINTVKNIVDSKVEKEINNGNYDINLESIYSEAITMISNANVNLKDISRNNLSYTMIEYYTLIAMTCLYGGMLSISITKYKLANMHSVGKRTSISSVKKGSMLIGSLLASYIVQLIGLFLLFMYTIFVLNINYGDKLPQIILLSLVGSLAGLSLGLAVGSLFKTNENVKTGILLSFTMLGCFLSGMMGITMKYIVDKNIPIINKLNPASMITDGFYSLYYYDTFDRYVFNIISLLIFSIVLLILSSISLRRQKYDSI